MLHVKQAPHWEVIVKKLNMSMSDFYESTYKFDTEEKALQMVDKVSRPESILSIREVSEYLPVSPTEVW